MRGAFQMYSLQWSAATSSRIFSASVFIGCASPRAPTGHYMNARLDALDDAANPDHRTTQA